VTVIRALIDTAAAPTPSLGAIRARRYRDRRKDGIRCARIRFSQQALATLVEGGFLPAAESQDNAAIERAVYGLLNAWHQRAVLSGQAR
jgi:hypothetical protein